MDGGSWIPAGDREDALSAARLPARNPDRGHGFRGETAKTRDAIVEGVDIGLGGSLGKDAAFIDWIEGAKPTEDVPDALVSVLERFQEERREGERFHEWARRKKNAELREALRKPVGSGVSS